MINIVRSDLLKLKKSAALKVMFLISGAGAVLMVLCAHWFQNGTLGAGAAANASFLADAQMVALLGTVAAGLFLCGDFENKTIHDAVSGGKGRNEIILGKAVSYFIVLLILILPYFLVAAAAIFIDSQYQLYIPSVFLTLICQESGDAVTLQSALKMIGITAAVCVVYAGQLSICLPLSFIFRRPVPVIGIGYLVSLICGMLQAGGNQAFQKLISLTPFHSKYLFRLSMDAEPEILLKSISAGAVFAALMILISVLIFRRAEIK
ncbi:hypothetical protein [Anaerostipes sp.]|uniref:hypothetical protein n=1 Tax=Anaerostipes sp. TaxID=1872530 RepID=UPI0025BD17A5|nr:hypothetical protein [Anaerostipes sp.]MBS7009308.1 hypothetical protein [Anaerostipes sp.]